MYDQPVGQALVTIGVVLSVMMLGGLIGAFIFDVVKAAVERRRYRNYVLRDLQNIRRNK